MLWNIQNTPDRIVFYKKNSESMPPGPHSTSVKPHCYRGLPKRLVCYYLFGGILGEAESILGILFGEHRRNTFKELRNLYYKLGEINALFLGSKGA